MPGDGPTARPPRVDWEPPTIAVVTPSYQMAGFLRDTIDSVLAQDWPRVEYLVMDGGSRDGTRELLDSYGDRLRWISRPDGGQADAVNRGLAQLPGELVTFLNADDTYRPGALRAAVEGVRRHPGAAAVYGGADYVDGDGNLVRPYPVLDYDRERLGHDCYICQPSAFVRRADWEAHGGLDATLHYALDYDLWIRLSATRPLARIPETLATSRMHRDNKSLGQRKAMYREIALVAKRGFGYVPMTWLDPYARHLVDGVDQFYEHSLPSRRSRALALALGLRHNPRQPRRLWRDWQADGVTDAFGDGWMSKACSRRIAVPTDASRLTVSGSHVADVRRPLLLTVSADGAVLGRIAVRRRGAFERSLPIPRDLRGGDRTVEIRSAWTWRPGARRGDTRRLSCRLATLTVD
jgi:glycosyltransferase involved in cell wall biosynthesis